MKKRVLSILLCLCMVLMLCPVTAFADENYTITQNFKYGTYSFAGDEPSPIVSSVALYNFINLGHIENCAPYEFVGWKESVSGTIYEPDYAIESVLGDMTFDAVYQVQGGLAVTVDGFEVGKTPADCTVTFDSTIPGVTFSADDVQSVVWARSIFDGVSFAWEPIGNYEAFEAGVSYRIQMNLDNKGLNTAPAVTVNGKTPEYCTIATRDGVPIQLQIGWTLGTPVEPTPVITINGPDVVCAQQDYEFTVTPPEGVTLDKEFGYDTGMKGGGADLTVDADGVGHGTVLTEWYDLNTGSFTLNAHGTTADGTPVTGTKTVQVSPEHIFVDGVCGCGAVQQYIVEYIGSGDDPICMDTKTHGEPLTLRGETFTMDGFVQTGWVDKETGAAYRLGDTYTENADVTLTPVFEKIITLTVPYTTTVELSDVGVPGEKTFTLALIGDSAPDKDKSNVTITGSVTTNGKGSYNGTLTFTGTERTLWVMLSEGAFVQQVDDGEAGWTVDDTVWGVLMEEIPVAYAVGDDAVASKYTVYAVPASIDGNGNYTIDWENVQKADMAFTNTYTDHVYELKHDATHHWDECACKDVQNKELHQYGDWTVTKAATETEEGQRERTCTVCDYKQTETIPVLEHTHDYTQKYDKTNHWDECDCGDIQNKEAHKYGEWKVTRKATETAKGEKEHTCTVCGYTEKAEIAKLGTVGTGDDSNIALWFALFTLSAAAVITTVNVSKKKKADR